MSDTQQWLDQYKDELYSYLTTTGRKSGNAHRIEIWFANYAGKMYLMAGGRDRSDWVKNVQENGAVTVELGDQVYPGLARIVAPEETDDALARELLVGKYGEGRDLAEWGRNSLPVVIEFAG